MIFTVIIALQAAAAGARGLRAWDRPGVRTVILIALLAIVRELMLVDLSATDAAEIFALAAAILALGALYWLGRDQDRREQA
jgi:uncharacterized membrane protein (DUF373 family)